MRSVPANHIRVKSDGRGGCDDRAGDLTSSNEFSVLSRRHIWLHPARTVQEKILEPDPVPGCARCPVDPDVGGRHGGLGRECGHRFSLTPSFRRRSHPWHGLEVGPELPRVVHAYVEITTFNLGWPAPSSCNKLTELGKRGILSL